MYFEKYQTNKQKYQTNKQDYLALKRSIQTGGVDWSKIGLPNYNNRNNNINNNINHHRINNNYYNNHNTNVDINLNLVSGKQFTISVSKNISMFELKNIIINCLVTNEKMQFNSILNLVSGVEVLDIDDSLLSEKIDTEDDIELHIVFEKKDDNIAQGDGFTAMLGQDNRILVWYDNNYRQDNIVIPEQDRDIQFQTISCYNKNIAAISNEGRLYCWGDDTYNQVSYVAQLDPTLKFTKVSCGFDFICAITEEYLYQWGNTVNLLEPIYYSPLVDIACGHNHVAAITSIGHIICWGNHSFNQVDPVPNDSLEENEIFTMVTCGPSYTAGLTSNGRVLCWGENDNGIIDLVSNNYLDERFVTISANDLCMYGITSDGTCVLWGYNHIGWDHIVYYTTIPELEPDEKYIYVTGDGFSAIAKTTRRMISWGPAAYLYHPPVSMHALINYDLREDDYRQNNRQNNR